MNDINPMSQASARHYDDVPVHRPEHREGALARLIEQHTAKVPSDWFLVSALGVMGLSLALELGGQRRWSRFVGMWPTPMLVMGIYNKFVKTLGPR